MKNIDEIRNYINENFKVEILKLEKDMDDVFHINMRHCDNNSETCVFHYYEHLTELVYEFMFSHIEDLEERQNKIKMTSYVNVYNKTDENMKTENVVNFGCVVGLK